MSRQPRVVCAGLFHETHTFVEGATPRAAFEFRLGETMLACAGDASPWGGALETARSLGWRIEPMLDARALPSAIVEDAVFEEFWSEFRDRAAHWEEGDIDGIFLVLHGAMVTPAHPDAEGELLRRIRELPALKHAPLAAVLDLHANMTPEMARHASALTAYRENPHTDGARDGATGRAAARPADGRRRDHAHGVAGNADRLAAGGHGHGRGADGGSGGHRTGNRA